MHKTSNILISLDERHVQSMLKGTKTIELRRRPIRISKGSKVWMYSKLPVGEICACGIVDEVVEAAPKDIWREYGQVSGIKRTEFNEYFSDRDIGCAIIFSSIEKLRKNISLDLMRATFQSFHPPQFFKHLNQDSEELSLLLEQQAIS
jgi:predicted transcriptional regulator